MRPPNLSQYSWPMMEQATRGGHVMAGRGAGGGADAAVREPEGTRHAWSAGSGLHFRPSLMSIGVGATEIPSVRAVRLLTTSSRKQMFGLRADFMCQDENHSAKFSSDARFVLLYQI